MDIIPAIDLMGGRVVRLYQGDYGQRTVFDDDPGSVAGRWKSLGARWVHVVDLDGSATGQPANLVTLGQIARVAGLLLEYGGGVREMGTARELFRVGVERIVLGTAAVEDPDLVQELVAQFGERIAVALDARGGTVSVRGWQQSTGVDVGELAQRMVDIGVRRFIYTDIRRDGTLTEPNFVAVTRLVRRLSVPVIASGGVSRSEHVRRLKEIGVEGVIIGRALYTGDMDLRQLILDFGGQSAQV